MTHLFASFFCIIYLKIFSISMFSFSLMSSNDIIKLFLDCLSLFFLHSLPILQLLCYFLASFCHVQTFCGFIFCKILPRYSCGIFCACKAYNSSICLPTMSKSYNANFSLKFCCKVLFNS